jgi:adenylate cyclase
VPSSTRTAYREAAIYENILVNMADGVISLDLEGKIMTFNPAAGRMLALAPDEVTGRTYAEIFFEDAGYDGLNELVLKAIYEAATTHSEEIEVRLADDDARNLLVSTTFLRAGSGHTGERLGVIVVISDVTEQRKRKKVKRLFGEYLDPRIVDGILNGEFETGGIRQTMTVSFCDLENFTALGEALDAEALIEFVNVFLAVMLPPIGRHGGVTDKYIGDAIMAFWNAPLYDPTHELNACEAALDMLERVERLNREREQAAKANGSLFIPINIGVGINTGRCVVGNMGSDLRFDYSVLGDSVNLASRLEGQCKSYGLPIIIGSRTANAAKDKFALLELDFIAVKGKKEPEVVYSIVGRNDEPNSGRFQRWRELNLSMLSCYRSRDWTGALAAVEQGLAADEENRFKTLYNIYAERIRAFQITPPPDDWDGAYALESK